MTREEERELLRLMKLAREETGLPLDFWADLIEGIPYKWAAILCGRSAIFPKNMNSNVRP
jgi:hypothetical protein